MTDKRGYSAVGLFNPKDPVNVGSVVRACGNYGVSLVAIEGRRYKRSCTDTGKFYRKIPLLTDINLQEVIPFDCIPVAVELIEGAKCLYNYQHPERAFYIFGQEDGTLGKRVLGYCKHKIYIPTYSCMNLAATVNVVLYDRAMKLNEYYIEGGSK